MNTLLLLTLAVATPPTSPAEPPLPEGAIARLGSPQWRNVADSHAFLAFTPDDHGIVIVRNFEVRAVEFDTGRERWKVGDIDFGPSAVLLPNDRILVGAQGVIRTHDLATGKELKQFKIATRNLTRLVGNKEYAAISDEYGDTRGGVIVFDLKSGAKVWEHGGRAQQNFYAPVAMAPGQPHLVTRVYRRPDSFVQVLDVNNKKLLHEWQLPPKGPGNILTALALSPDGRSLWVGDGKTVRLCDVATGKEQSAWEGHTDEVVAAAFSADGKRLVTGAKDQTLRWWDLATGKELGKIDVGRTPYLIAVSQGGHRAVAVCGGENTLRRFNLSAGRELTVEDGHTNLIEQVAFLPDGKSLLTAGRDGTVRVWDIASRREVRRWKPKVIALAWLAISADGKLAATASYNDKLIEIRDIASGTVLRSFPNPGGAVGCLAFAPTGATLAAGPVASRDSAIHLWNAATGQKIGELVGPASGLSRLSFDSSGQRLISSISDIETITAVMGASGHGAPRVWDVKSGRAALLGGDNGCMATFAPDGRSVAMNCFRPRRESETHTTARYTSDLMLVELASGAARLTFAHRPLQSDRIEFSPDGRLLAVPPPHREGQRRRDGGFCILDVETGRELRRFGGDYVWHFAFSPDGKALATGGLDGTILLWDVSKLRPATPANLEVSGALWTDLAADAPTAYRAIVALGHAGERGVALLKENLKPAQSVEAKTLAQLLADLEDERFAVRLKAAAELTDLDLLSADAMRKRLKTTTSAEARKTITKLLENLDGWLTNPHRLREVRAVEALQRNNAPAARRLLEELAKGDPAARLTREARAALGR